MSTADGQGQLYFFELRYPGQIRAKSQQSTKIESYVVPLVLSPESITISEPFTSVKTPTSGGGLSLEEAGVLTRTLHITGTTGQLPKAIDPKFADARTTHIVNPTQTFEAREPRDKETNQDKSPQAKLTGQEHFQLLQDRIFRLYGDLKRNPNTAYDTTLIWHNKQDREHFIVVPERFDLRRAVARRFLYQYSITCTIIDRAENLVNVASANRAFRKLSWFEGLIADVMAAIAYVEAIVSAITAAIGTIKKYVRTIRAVISKVQAAISLVSSIVAGVRTLTMDIASALIHSVTAIGEAISGIVDQIESFATLPSDISALWDRRKPYLFLGSDAAVSAHMTKDLHTGLTSLGISLAQIASLVPQTLDPSIQTNTAGLTASSASSASSSTSAQQLTLSAGTTTLEKLQAALAVSAAAAEAQKPSGGNDPKYTAAAADSGVSLVIVQAGDTLNSIARQHLGDSTRAAQIARLNDLRYPYISQAGLPKTKKVGDTILIPTDNYAQSGAFGTASATRQVEQTTLGQLVDVPGIVAGKIPDNPELLVYGTDFQLDVVSGIPGRAEYDFVLDAASGYTDFALSSGPDNLRQALRTRVTTEQGTDPLFSDLGYEPLTALSTGQASTEFATVRLAAAASADPRVTQVTNVELVQTQSPDAVHVRMDVIGRQPLDIIQFDSGGHEYLLHTQAPAPEMPQR